MNAIDLISEISKLSDEAAFSEWAKQLTTDQLNQLQCDGEAFLFNAQSAWATRIGGSRAR